jgi:DNA repair ATPase RecN
MTPLELQLLEALEQIGLQNKTHQAQGEASAQQLISVQALLQTAMQQTNAVTQLLNNCKKQLNADSERLMRLERSLKGLLALCNKRQAG